jgi:glycine/D-amino acid oxidase-like deaminating enzyme
MKVTNNVIRVDVAIIGGGIAGLWLLSRLRARGYGAVLIESERLGTGQTICSQGIIHGGAKYSLRGQVSESAKAVAEMPALWRRCLKGEGGVDLHGAALLAEHQYLWATRSPASRLVAFFASRLLRSRMEKVTAAGIGAGDYPPALRHPEFRGAVYRLDEPIIDIASVLSVLADRQREAIALCCGPAVPSGDGAITLRHPGRPTLVVRPACTVFTAGAGNAALPWAAMQLRPLHMVLARGPGLPGLLYAHCAGASEVPRLTVTTHYDATGRLIWYLGGGLAEEGVKRDRAEQIRAARRELAALLPWADWSRVEYSTLTVKRAEAWQSSGARPPGPSVFRDGRTLVAWPTKLSLTPLLVERVEQALKSLDLRPKPADLRLLADWPRPEVAAYPWDQDGLAWS